MSIGGPESVALQRGIAKVLGVAELVSIERIPNVYRGAFASERVRCVLPDGRRVDLFAKYGSAGTHSGHGYWGGVDREAWAYEHLFPKSSVKVPTFVGAHNDPQSGETWLFLEWLDAAHGLFKSGKEVEDALREAVQWLARFHAEFDDVTDLEMLERLPTYDADFYRGWWERTHAYSAPLISELPWLPEVLERIRPSVETLAEGPHCVIHGEYYPHNILHHEGELCPADWQSAAIGKGEIDLASVLEGWEGTRLYAELVELYRQNRWPREDARDVRATLRRASLYWPLRWLGDSPDGTLHPKQRWWFEKLRAVAAEFDGVTA